MDRRSEPFHRRLRRILPLTIALSSVASAAPLFTLTDLGTLGGDYSGASGINNLGQVVGGAGTADGGSHAFLWDPESGIQDLGTVPSRSSTSWAADISDQGQVAGYGSVPEIGGQKSNALRWSDGIIERLGDLGALFPYACCSWGYGINDSGDVVGETSTRHGSQNRRAFLYTGGEMQELPSLNPAGSISEARDINNAGDIVGTSYTGSNFVRHAFLYSGGSISDLGALGVNRFGSDYSYAYGMNDKGQVVGVSSIPGAEMHKSAFIWDSVNGMQSLGGLGGGSSVAYAVNEAGWVVGTAPTTEGSHAFLHREGTMLDLNDLIPAGSGWTLTFATDINDQGQICGVGVPSGSSQGRAFLLTPEAAPPPPPPPPPEHIIDGVPDYLWNYGCFPTAGGMIVGYWDTAGGFSGLVGKRYPELQDTQMPPCDAVGRDGDGDAHHDSSPANRVDGANKPFRQGTRQWDDAHYNLVDRVIATKEHVTDYWWGEMDPETGKYVDRNEEEGRDPYESAPTPWVRHPHNCLADFMGTSQSDLSMNDRPMTDGQTFSPDHLRLGLRDFMEYSRDSSTPLFSVRIVGSPEFAWVKEELSRWRGGPLIANVYGWYGWDHEPLPEDSPPWGHPLVVYGYWERDDGPWIAVRDGWGEPALVNGHRILADNFGGQHEWWKWDNPGFEVDSMVTASPVTLMYEGFRLFCDAFDSKATALWGLPYSVDTGSGSGTAEIVSSPLGGDNGVLMLSQPDPGSFVAIEQDTCVATLTGLSFEYLFASAGKLSIELDDKLLAEILAPSSGAGAPGSDSFGFFSQVFSMAGLGLDPYAMHTLRIELSAPGDPVCYLDNLRVWNAVPEPATVALLSVAALLLRRRRRG